MVSLVNTVKCLCAMVSKARGLRALTEILITIYPVVPECWKLEDVGLGDLSAINPR